mgnify:CR=1 FL=1
MTTKVVKYQYTATIRGGIFTPMWKLFNKILVAGEMTGVVGDVVKTGKQITIDVKGSKSNIDNFEKALQLIVP